MLDFILNPELYMMELIHQYGNWIYVILFMIIFCETGLIIFPFLPGDSLLFLTGTLSANSTLQVNFLIAILLIAALGGNSTNYWIGRSTGSYVLKHHSNARWFSMSAYKKTCGFYQQYGGKTIVICRFLPIFRTFAPFVAGATKMPYRYFLALDCIGATTWILSMVLGGYWFGELPIVKNNLFLIICGVIFISLIPPGILFFMEKKKLRNELKKS